MFVETFFDEETAVVNDEEKELMIEMSQKLGLNNQVEQLQNNTINSYRQMSAEEVFVYSVNFPEIVQIKNYKGAIPLRVLQIISHFLEIHQGYFVKFMCPEPGKKDPVVIAGNYEWSGADGNQFILCRFGDALEEFSVLRKKAYQVLKERINIESMGYSTLKSIWDSVKQ